MEALGRVESCDRGLEFSGMGSESEEDDVSDISDGEDKDEGSMDDLIDRFRNVDIENLSISEIESRLTEAERVEFRDLISHELCGGFVEIWRPWWEVRSDGAGVVVPGVSTNQTQVVEQPIIFGDIPEFPAQRLLKPETHQHLPLSLLSIILSYTYTWRYFNGDVTENVEDVMDMLWTSSEVLRGELTAAYESAEDCILRWRMQFQVCLQFIFKFENKNTESFGI